MPTGEGGGASARLELTGVVETALARALMLAAENKRWDIVEKIAAELRARRSGSAENGPGESPMLIQLYSVQRKLGV